ncbi:MAG: DNA primase, partial [Bacteroidota bacterium]|nr:DNA primase [Bacteroidota bacterium]
MKLNQDIIDQIHDRLEIEEVVSDFVSLKRKGQNLWACCPFHHEKSPSFSVVPSKGFYKCFGCGKSGDAIQFLMDLEGLSYLEAMLFLAKKYSIEIREEEQTDQQQKEQNEKESLHIVLNYAKDFFKDNLWLNEEGRAIGLSYFRERGFTEVVMNAFELGYSQDGWDYLLKDAEKKGYNPDILEKAGLIVRTEGKVYDRFRGRVIFPIHNVTGKTIAFGARILKPDKKQPKYLNSPETEVYHKSKTLYGLYQGKQSIRQKDNCYLVEGYTDVISLHLSGVENVVSSSGTSLTEEQVKVISRYTKNITVLFDGDVAGMKASLRGID